MIRRFRLLTICVVCALLTSLSYAADKVPTPEERAYKFRTSLFQTLGWKYGQMIGAKAKDDQTAFSKHAADMSYLAGLIEEGFLLENSLPEGTEAKPVIWEEFEGFKEKANELVAAASDLSKEGAMADFDPKKFGSKSCGGCHRKFRIKK